MTDRSNLSRKQMFAIIGMVLVAAVIATYSLQNIEHRQRVGEMIALTEQGMSQFREGQYELSLRTLGSIPDDLVEDWHIPYYVGAALIKKKDYEAATVQLEKALALNTTEKVIPYALGVAYYKLGNLSLSKAYFALVLEIDPNHKEAKGLMDVMANLERMQPGANQADPTQAKESEDSSH